MNSPAISVSGVAKQFVMHLQGGKTLNVVDNASFAVHGGECVVLGGPSGAGKSSILKMIYGNYRVDAGSITLAAHGHCTDIASALPREVLRLRQHTIGYVSQFLRVIPRISALDIVAEARRADGAEDEVARQDAKSLLARLNVPERLWGLAPATFSGGEQQRVNIARGFAASRPILLLDEPTASLDARNRAVVVELIRERKAEGVAILGIFHDEDVRDAVADRIVDVTTFAAQAA